MRIGYLVPEFPGQTHGFFWREIQTLKKINIFPRIVSTRLPRSGIEPYVWSAGAIKETAYLFPPDARSIINSILELLRAGPASWLRCLSAIRKAEGLSFIRKIRLLGLVLLGSELAWLSKREGWSHIHVHSVGDAANIAMFASILSGLTYSMTLHCSFPYKDPDQRQKWKHASFAIVVSKNLLDEVRSMLSDCLPKKIEVASMGADVNTFKRSSPYKPWPGKGPCFIFSCGRLHKGKGHDYLIRAISLLKNKGLDIHLSIAGGEDTPKYTEHLMRLIAELSLDSNIQLLGALSEDKIVACLEKAHIFALATLSEALGIVIAEAMAMEVPVVAANVGGIPELVDNNVNGILVEPGNPERMANAIFSILTNKDLACRLSGAGRGKIEKKFNSNISAETIAKCLKDNEY